MDERHEELAALNALGMLEGDEKRVLHGASVADRDLRALTAQLEETVSELGHLVAPVEPPADMKRRIRSKIRSSGGPKWRSLSPSALLGGAGWAVAAGLAVSSVWLWQEREKLSQQVAAVSKAMASVTPLTPSAEMQEPPNLENELKKLRDDFEAKKAALTTELDSLRKRETEAAARIAQLVAEAEAQKQREAGMKVEIVTLQSKVWEYRRSEMTVVWDGGKRQGVLLLDKMPRVDAGKDYQLWVVDPQKPDPVSAGVITVDDKGMAKTSFKPVDSVGESVKFALSVEKKGGVPKNEGPIVLVGP